MTPRDQSWNSLLSTHDHQYYHLILTMHFGGGRLAQRPVAQARGQALSAADDPHRDRRGDGLLLPAQAEAHDHT